MCSQEVNQGARDRRAGPLLLSYLETQERLVSADPWETHVEAARVFFHCGRRGVTALSTLDCLIAQMALERDATLLHSDTDYERIAQVRPLRLIRP